MGPHVKTFDGRVGYCFSSKCASRSMLGWLALCKNPNLLVEHPEKFQHRDGYPGLRALTKNITREEFMQCEHRICVVRDPLERYLSCYKDRVVRLERMGPDYPSINEFVRHHDALCAEYKDLAIHFQSLCEYLGDPGDFTNIFRHDKLDDVREFLGGLYGIELPDIRLQSTSGVKPVDPSDYSSCLITDRYLEDYRQFGKFFL